MRKRIRVLIAVLCSLAIQSSASATEPPSNVLDLSSWKLTLPLDTPKEGRPDEVRQPELDSFQDRNCFFVNDANDGVVFRAHCGGSTTKGSKYPRCELREMSDLGSTSAAWATDDRGIHTLTAMLAITKIPAVKKHVVCAQIHDADDDLLLVRLEGRKLLIERSAEEDVVLATDYVLGTPFELKLQAGNGHVQVWHGGVRKLDWEVSRTGCYFKAGCYTQSNPDRGDAPDAYGEVIIYRLQVVHRE